MNYETPTYEEYCKASTFAKVRYRYGVYIQLVSGILLLLLFIYAFTNIEEMKANPVAYAEEKIGVVCHSPMDFGTTYTQNGIIGNITNTKKKPQ